ncbi:hypothetical protein Plhal304r1_c012g0048091 [Plasmopara halstedii]
MPLKIIAIPKITEGVVVVTRMLSVSFADARDNRVMWREQCDVAERCYYDAPISFTTRHVKFSSLRI